MKLETKDHHLTGHFETRAKASSLKPAALMQADPKKQGKEKKPDGNLVSRVFPER